MDLPLADAFDTGGKWSSVSIDTGQHKYANSLVSASFFHWHKKKIVKIWQLWCS
jgi:hypothetical protein